MTILLKICLFINLITIAIATGGIFQLQIIQSQQQQQQQQHESQTNNYKICIKNYQINIDNNYNNCYIGQTITNKTNIPINFEFKFRWPGTFSIIIEKYNNLLQNEIIKRVAVQKYLEIDTQWSFSELQMMGGSSSAFISTKSSSSSSSENTIINVDNQQSNNEIKYKYRVICLKNYYSKDCNKYCKERNDKFGHYFCGSNGEIKCLNGWEGVYCEKATCTPQCSNLHGYCTEPSTCLCHAGWTGPSCTECKQYPGCKNGKCVKQWECECYEGWGGLFCNQDLNYCTNHKPCKNNGTCFNTGQGSYTCDCLNGWGGIDCDQQNGSQRFNTTGIGCDTMKNSTICQQTPQQQPTPKNNTTIINIDFCKTHPCANGGTCTNTKQNSYICSCPTPFHGQDCSCNCYNNAQCDNKNNCICPIGFYGQKCELNESNYTLGMIQQILEDEQELGQEHVIFIIISSISIPFLICFSCGIVFYLKRKRAAQIAKLDSMAVEQNEINIVNNLNKIKDEFIQSNIYIRNDFGSKFGSGNVVGQVVVGQSAGVAIATNQDIEIEHEINEGLERVHQHQQRVPKNVNLNYQNDELLLQNNLKCGGTQV